MGPGKYSLQGLATCKIQQGKKSWERREFEGKLSQDQHEVG